MLNSSDIISLISAIFGIGAFLVTAVTYILNKNEAWKLRIAVAGFIIFTTAAVFFVPSFNTSLHIRQVQNSFNDITSHSPSITYPLTTADSYWQSGQPHGDSGNCSFQKDGLYHIAMKMQDHVYGCYAANTNFQNFIYQVEMQIIQGDAGGLIFRADITDTSSKFYYFYITESGSYILSYWPDDVGTGHAITLAQGENSSFYDDQIHHRASQIAVKAQGNNFYLYINGTYVNEAQDTHLPNGGQIGLVAHKTLNTTEVGYRQVQIWTL